jgi:hypothetical protein
MFLASTIIFHALKNKNKKRFVINNAYNCTKNGNNGIHDMNNKHYGDDGGGRKEESLVVFFLKGCYREVFHSSLL